MKMAISMSFIIILFTSACAQNSKNNPSETVKENSSEAVAKAPAMNIHAAVLSGNLSAVQQHIKAGTDINEKDAMSGSTALITAASFDKPEIVKALIDGGANLTLTNNDGATALHTASFFGRIEIVQMLIDAGADQTLKNNFGATAKETVMGEFSDVKPIYEMLKQQLAPFGFELDLKQVENARPVITKMLQ